MIGEETFLPPVDRQGVGVGVGRGGLQGESRAVPHYPESSTPHPSSPAPRHVPSAMELHLSGRAGVDTWRHVKDPPSFLQMRGFMTDRPEVCVMQRGTKGAWSAQSTVVRSWRRAAQLRAAILSQRVGAWSRSAQRFNHRQALDQRERKGGLLQGRSAVLFN